MRKRVRGGKAWYYYDMGGKPRKEIPLGDDYVLAVRKWSELHIAQPAAQPTWSDAAARYEIEVIPTKATRTQQANRAELAKLREWFGDAPNFEAIKPMTVAQYLDHHRARKVAANREIALFSHVWNKARAWGYTELTNPCIGIARHKERRRETYIEDDEFYAVLAVAAPPLADTMRLMYLTGQRLSDVLKMRETDIRDGVLTVKQGKTGATVRIQVSGSLATLIERIRAEKAQSNVYSTAFITGEGHKTLGRNWLSKLWSDARAAAGVSKDLQLRDLRAKAGTDVLDVNEAQKLLGHKSRSTTEIYRRSRETVAPTAVLRNGSAK
jgi:integrase